MARNYTDDERAAILAKSYELLARDVTDTRQVSEPELTPDEIRQLAFQRPAETHNQKVRREIDERNALWAAKREAKSMSDLETRLARERDAIYQAVAEVFARFCAPYEEQLSDLRAEIVNSRGRDGVSVTAVAFNHKGELLLTLSDGTVLNPPGRIVSEELLKQRRAEEVEPIDVPPVLRRVR